MWKPEKGAAFSSWVYFYTMKYMRLYHFGKLRENAALRKMQSTSAISDLTHYPDGSPQEKMNE